MAKPIREAPNMVPWSSGVEAEAPTCYLCTWSWCIRRSMFQLKFVNRMCYLHGMHASPSRR